MAKVEEENLGGFGSANPLETRIAELEADKERLIGLLRECRPAVELEREDVMVATPEREYREDVARIDDLLTRIDAEIGGADE